MENNNAGAATLENNLAVPQKVSEIKSCHIILQFCSLGYTQGY
jgi:hypothetical protein